jgi:hypothetical protein
MTHYSNLLLKGDYAWLIAVPKRQEFTQPTFHLGERVKWSGESPQGHWCCQTGRIMGLTFTSDQQWHYDIQIDPMTSDTEVVFERVWLAAIDLKLLQDAASVRRQLQPASEWMATQAAAATLGLSPAQLRKLRRKQLFKVGYHYRDTSVPGSGLPRWQWHVARCGKALEIPPEKRPLRAR